MSARQDNDITGGHFVNEWRVIEGHSSRRGRGDEPDESIAVIRHLDTGQFEIGFRPSKGKDVQWKQTLSFNSRTNTLDDDDPHRGGPDRCISFWDCKARGAQHDRIFAMRKAKKNEESKKNQEDSRPLEEIYFPWELRQDEDGNFIADPNGTWGAEEGGG